MNPNLKIADFPFPRWTPVPATPLSLVGAAHGGRRSLVSMASTEQQQQQQGVIDPFINEGGEGRLRDVGR